MSSTVVPGDVNESPVPPDGGEGEPKRGFALPSAYTILFILIFLTAIATWIIPAGTYDYNADGEPIPQTYHEIEHDPQQILLDSIKAPINGLYGIEDETGNISFWNYGELFGAIDVALFVIIIGGFLGVTMKTGAINAGIARVVTSMTGRERLMIPILMIIFALGGTTYGMAEETLAFYPLIVTVMIAAGYDSLVGASVLLLGAGIGVLGSTINPFATGIASGFAGVSIAEGLVLRLVVLVVGLIIGVIFVMRYADRVRQDPSKSLVYAQKAENEARFLAGQEAGSGFGTFTGRHKGVLILFFLAFLVMIYGVIPWEDLGIAVPTLWWWFPEMTASFILFAILVGIAGGLSESDLTGSFVDGARDLLGVALIIGIARGITVIMNNGMITDTVLSWAESAVADTSGARFVLLLFLLFIPLSLLIPSTSGLATVAMPIMVPLAAFAMVPGELVVSAFQFASGLVNMITPTSAVVMGGLAIARVGYGTWWKFSWPILLILGVLSMVGLAIASAM
ncbi:MAG: putative rane protein [Thermomicrobiales bacterium]|jgi:uncharacterized ion transporter superfamily protein YfcC|nr:putative rane protein [Thermomicrobiales bacterium]MDF3041951.1 putative rane protein [Thermomicrobiales bacterium]